MRGEALGNPARGRDNIHVFVPVTFAGESNHGAVGRKEGIGLNPYIAGQMPSCASIAAHDPETSAVAERNLGSANGRLSPPPRRAPCARGSPPPDPHANSAQYNC